MEEIKKDFEASFKITTNLRDCYDYIKPSTILDLSQEIACDHADILHVGFDDFIKNNWIWVIVRNKYVILKHVKNLKHVRVYTYPLKNRLFEQPRDYEFYDYDTNELIMKGRSIWVVFNIETKKIEAPDLRIYDPERKGVFEERVKKLEKIDISKEDYVKDIIVTQSMLDHNGHLNNTRTLDYFIDLFNPKDDLFINSFQVEYVSQCYLNDLLSLYKKKIGNKYYIYIYKDEELKIYYEFDCNY